MSQADHDFDLNIPTLDWGAGQNRCKRCGHLHWVHDDPLWPDNEYPDCVCLQQAESPDAD